MGDDPLTPTSETERAILGRVQATLDARISADERRSRRRVRAGVIGAVVVGAGAIGGATALHDLATPRMLESTVVCFQSLDTSGDLHFVGYVDGQSMPEDLAARAVDAVELCESAGEIGRAQPAAVCVRPDGLWAVFPREEAKSESEVCDQVGYRWALSE